MTYAAPTAERRVAPRAPWYGQALLHMQQRRLGCTVVDVSASGLLVVPPARAPKGAALEIDLMLPPHLEPVRLAAVVAREGDVHGHYAWGLRFVDPPAVVQTAIAAFVSSVRQRLGAEHAALPAGPAAAAPTPSSQYSQVPSPRFRSDPAARVVAPAAAAPATTAPAARAVVAGPAAPAPPRPSAASSAATARTGSSGSYHKVFPTAAGPTPTAAAAAAPTRSPEARAGTAPGTPARGNTPAPGPGLAGLTTPIAQPRPTSGRTLHDTTPNLGVRVARPGSSPSVPVSPPSAARATSSAPPAARRSSSPGASPPNRTPSSSENRRATRDWDERAHCTPIEVRELYEAALSEVDGRSRPRKR